MFRSYAHHGVFQDIRVVAIEALVDFIKSKLHLLLMSQMDLFSFRNAADGTYRLLL